MSHGRDISTIFYFLIIHRQFQRISFQFRIPGSNVYIPNIVHILTDTKIHYFSIYYYYNLLITTVSLTHTYMLFWQRCLWRPKSTNRHKTPMT